MGRYYTKQGYALLATDEASEGHWFGGEPYHLGAECPVCKIPLILLADLNCEPFRSREQAKLFHELERLPLYYCWRCSANNLSYQMPAPGRVRILRNEGRPQGNDFPYPGFPGQFPRRPVKVVPIPYDTAKLLALSQEVDPEWLSPEDRDLLASRMRALRHEHFSKNDINRHQIGGLLNLIQGHESVACPNPGCGAHKSCAQVYELAVIHDDPASGLPMVEAMEEFRETGSFNEWVQVIYWVCDECLTIAASNRCD